MATAKEANMAAEAATEADEATQASDYYGAGG